MATVSERARGVASKLADSMLVDDLYADEAAAIIEQALLAERQEVFEAAIKIANDHANMSADGKGQEWEDCADYIAAALRAAAEKEVSK